MDNEKRKAELLEKKDNLTRKSNWVRVFGGCLLVIMLAAYYCKWYVLPVAIVSAAVGLLIFLLIGIPLQRRLAAVRKEMKEIGE